MSQNTANSEKRRPPGDKPADDRQDSDWGFDPDDADPGVEKKLGLILVVCLLAGFGFVFYQKFRLLQADNTTAATGSEIVAPEDEVTSPTDEPTSGHDDTATIGIATSSDSDTQSGVGSPFFETPSPSDEESEEADWSLTHGNLPSQQNSPARANQTSAEFDPFAGAPESPESPEQSSAPPPDKSPTIIWNDPPAAPPQSIPEPDPAVVEEHNSGPVVEDDASPFSLDRIPREDAAADFEDAPAMDEPGRLVFEETPEARTDGPIASSANPLPPLPQPAPNSGESPADQSMTPPEPDDTSFNPFASIDDSPDAEDLPAQEMAPEPALPSQSEQKLAQSEPETADPTGSLPPFPFPAPNAQQPLTPEEPVTLSPTKPVAVTEPPVWPFAEQTRANARPAPSSSADDPAPFSFDGPAKPAEQATVQQTVTLAPPPQVGFSELPMSANSSGAQPVIGERELIVTPSDSFWSISEREYGTSRYFKALAEYNRDRVAKPEQLQSGIKLRIPPPEVLEAQFPDLFRQAARSGGTVSPINGSSDSASGFFLDTDLQPRYRVGERDTLSSIAQLHLGRATRWTEVYELNRDQLKSPSTVKIGMVLKLPADAGRVSVSPAGGFDR